MEEHALKYSKSIKKELVEEAVQEAGKKKKKKIDLEESDTNNETN
jgi:hypothetical protein